MRRRSLWSNGVSGICMLALTAAFTVIATGCHGSSRTKSVAGCKTTCGVKCVGKCAAPGKNSDGTAKCGPDCKKPCCAQKDDATPAPPATSSADVDRDAKLLAAVNQNCPMSGRPIRTGITTLTDGKTVGFCCGGCMARWEGLTQVEQQQKLTGAM